MRLLLIALLLSLPAGAQADLAHTRAQHLQRGINAGMWFAQNTSDYTPERLRAFTTADDIALMERLGFDHVRLSVDATPLGPAALPPPSSPNSTASSTS